MKHPFLLALLFLPLAACTSLTGDVIPSGQSSSASSLSSDSSSSVASEPDVVVDAPVANAIVTTPIVVSGKAKGTWFFEATLPVRLVDDAGNEIATSHGDAQGDWMTDQYVPFSAQLHYTTGAPSGFVVIEKDNPSGDPSKDASVKIPVRFQ